MRHLVRFVSALCAACALFSGAAYATSADDASAYIQKVANQTLDTIANQKLNKTSRQAKLEKIFSDNVDTAWVGRFVMGAHWRKATDDQKKRYLSAYDTFIVRHYAVRFTEYTGGKFKITGAHDEGNDEYTVSMEIQASENAQEPILLDYRLRKEKAGFRIFDIIIEGVSMITTQRAEFGTVLNEKGIDQLISQLETKSKEALEKKSTAKAS
ncbi:MAG: ABC transporter substrate-binding protein [Rickettsiales bacterium]|nr:ABC transporter substrate-binding protein [Rickettsiales bacterium]